MGAEHTYGNNNGGWFHLTQQQNPFSKLNYGSTIGALGSVAGQLGNSFISDGYSDGVGSGIANIGGTLGGAISTVNPLVGGIVSAASGIVGGLTNRAFGTKENKANISAITQNTQNMNLLGNQIAGAGDSGSFFKLAGNMGTSSGFSSGDLVKGGWFSKGKARRKAHKYLNAENNALAFQNHGMALGALGVDQNQDDNTLAHFSAYGGPLNMINNDNMGAIEYGFMSDWLANKRAKEDRLKDNANSLIGEPLSTLFADGGKIEIKHPGRLTALKKRTGKTEAELWAEGKPEVRKMITFARNARKWKKAYGGYLDSVGKLNDTLFALGGDLQSHGSDWSNGASYIGAGLSHEMNPNGGVQVGVDSQGTPNLVEQDEVIYDDYVYSNRIPIDAATKEKFHIGKKKDMTYADLAKKLGKEIEERPNDPISKAGYRSQMLALQEEQERQKAEMEAERAREAFASLSPEEQTAVMQQVAQQEQMAQEQAVQEQAMAEQAQMQQAEPQQPVEEEMYAPEEMGYMPEEVPTEEMPEEGYAEGGNLYADGGALEWLKKNHPEMGNKEEIAKVMENMYQRNDTGQFSPEMREGLRWSRAYDFTTKGLGNFRDHWLGEPAERREKHYKELLSYGMNPKVAFGLVDVLPNEADFKYESQKPQYKKYVSERNARWKKMMDTDYADWTNANKVAMQGNIPEVTITAQKPASSVEKTKASSDSSKAGLRPNSETNGSGLFSNIRSKMNEAMTNAYNQIASQGVSQVENNLPQTEQFGYNGEAPAPRRGNTGNRGKGYVPRAAAPSSSPVVNGTPSVVASPSTATTQQAVIPVVSAPAAPIVTNDGIAINPLTGEPDYDPTQGIVRDGNFYVSSDFSRYSSGEPSSSSSSSSSTSSPAADTAKANEESVDKRVPFVTSKESRLRYIPAIGGAIGLAYDLFSKPDYSRADAVINASRNMTPMMIQPTYLGDYLTYRPMDIWAEQNRMNANARATDRVIRNSNSPSRMAGLLANGYNSQIASGDLYRKALEYNNALRERTAAFNRGTNQFNAQMNTNTQRANQSAALSGQHYGLQGLITGNQMKDAIDARRGASISANLGNVLQSLGNIGEEAFDMDRFRWLEATDVLRSKVLNQNKYGGMLTKKNKKGGKC